MRAQIMAIVCLFDMSDRVVNRRNALGDQFTVWSGMSTKEHMYT